MNYTVILFTLFLFLNLTEAGKKGKKNGQRRTTELNQRGCPSKKTLKLQLSQLADVFGRNGVLVVPNETHAIRDGSEVITSQSYTDGPNVGRCKEVTYRDVSNNRIPTTVLRTRCICQDCEDDQGRPTAKCDPIEYRHNVLILPKRKSDRCVKGLLRYEETTETVIVGCKYTVL